MAFQGSNPTPSWVSYMLGKCPDAVLSPAPTTASLVEPREEVETPDLRGQSWRGGEGMEVLTVGPCMHLHVI